MHPHIFASLRGYSGEWAHTLDEGKDISMQDLLMHMEKTFGNKCDYDAKISILYKVQQKEDEMVEEYMLHIHDMITMICHAYPECLPDHGRDLKKDHFYHGLHPYLHDAFRFAQKGTGLPHIQYTVHSCEEAGGWADGMGMPLCPSNDLK